MFVRARGARPLAQEGRTRLPNRARPCKSYGLGLEDNDPMSLGPTEQERG